MTLLDKIINESKIQEQLNAQLAEMSYRAVNGTRQAPRNFTEGILNVGTMNFKTPDDKITKEMIMDYQQKEQEKYYVDASGNKLKNVPTGLSDIIIPYVPKDYGTTGAEADTTTLQTVQGQQETLYKDFLILQGELKTKKKELKQKQNDLIRKEKEEQNLNSSLIEVENELIELNKQLKKAKTSKNKAELNTKITELTAEKKRISIDIKTTSTEIIPIKADVTTVEGEIIKIETNITAKEKEMFDQDVIIKQVKDNIEENKVGRQKNTIENKKVTKKYEETFNYINRNRDSVQQDQNESDADFLTRIKSMESLPYDPNIFKGRAEIEGNRKFMENLKQITRDEIKIADIAKSFPKPEDIFILNNNWDAIFNQLKIKFGINNPNISVNEYRTEIKDIMQTLINTPFGTTIVPSTASAGPVTRTYQATVPGGKTPIDHIDGKPSDFAYTVENNSLYIENTKESKRIYLKIAEKSGKKYLLFSDSTNEENKFRAFNFSGDGIKSLQFKTVMTELKINEKVNSDIRVNFFGVNRALNDRWEFLKKTFGLKSVVGKPFIEESKAIVGYGIKEKEVPQLIDFGKNILLLNKLYHKNILSIKNKKMHAVENFPNIKVSDKLVEIIYDMYYNKKPSNADLDSLKTSERELFDLLLYVSGLSKKFLTMNKKDEYINELKERLKLVEGEIRAGNDNPVAKSELKDIVHKLQLYNVISMNNAKSYLKQF